MMDAVFRSWRDSGLVWLPERGMGYFPVCQQPYDDAYFEKYEGYAASEMGRKVTAARVKLVRRHWRGEVCDVGIGCGAFIEAHGNASGYDVNPAGVVWLKDRHRFRDPFQLPTDAVTFWDVIEHIPDIDRLLANVRRWVFASLPVVPGHGPPSLDWKHLRRDEHCWYWTRDGFIRWMREHGFECVEHSTAESLLGREDIGSFAFRRVAERVT